MEKGIIEKTKKIVEKYGLIIIIALLVAFIVVFIAFLRERNKNKEVERK